MALAADLLKKISNPRLSKSERALFRCALARELEAGGSFEAARGALGEIWVGVGERPRLHDLEPVARATVLLRAGTLTGSLGSTQQLPQAAEAAKDLISEALNCYITLGERERAVEARLELAWCYWREGAFDEARVMLLNATDEISAEEEPELCALALVRRAIVEKEMAQCTRAFVLLGEAAPLVQKLAWQHTLKGTYYNTLALILRSMGEAERREEYIARALVEFATASHHFEQAGHTRERGAVENNLGDLYLKAGKLEKAREHLDRARRLFESVKDEGRLATVNEALARLLLAEGRNFKAERSARVAVNILGRGGEQARLIEALTTHAVALARLGQHASAKSALTSAIEIGEQIGCHEGAGRAALTLLEELADHLAYEEIQEAYDSADSLLLRREAQSIETTERLRACARLIIQAARGVTAKMEHAHAGAFIHASPRTRELLDQVERAARTNVTILITGETGTGKEVLAAQIHAWSGRPGAFVAVNCAGLNENLIESEVFGHRRGAFTDAIQDHAGAAKSAAYGTLFLDEIGELSPANQAKLLRLLESKEIKAVGSDATEQIDVRIVAATNRDLSKLVSEGRFRLDLYHRLCVFEVEIPPLRERAEDIRPLAEHFITAALERHKRQLTFPEETLAAISKLELPGNARELRSLVERTVILGSEGGEVTPLVIDNLTLRRQPTAKVNAEAQTETPKEWSGRSLAEEIKAYEKELIRSALQKSGGSITEAARLLGISHQALTKKINSAHKDLQAARKQPRRRSIFRKKN